MKGCLGKAIFFLIGTAIVFTAFALGRARGTNPDKPKLSIGDLRQALHDTQVDARRQAAEALGQQGPDAEGAVPDLVKLLQDKSTEVREAAAEALGKIGPKAEDAIPALKEALQSGSEDVARKAREALDRIEKRFEHRVEDAGKNDDEKTPPADPAGGEASKDTWAVPEPGEDAGE